MKQREILICECGGRVMRPIPERCPHCGQRILSVRRRIWPKLLAAAVVAALFGLLTWFVLYLVG